MLQLFNALNVMNERFTKLSKQILADKKLSPAVIKGVVDHQMALLGVIEALQKMEERQQAERNSGTYISQPFLPGLEPTSDEEVMEA